MRSLLFNLFFFATTFIYACICVILSFLPGRTVMMHTMNHYTRLICWGMNWITGIHIIIKGRENLPKDKTFIIAAKHQSYGDGIIMFSQFFDLSFVAASHLEKFLFFKRILSKAGAVIIDSCGGFDSRRKMAEKTQAVRDEKRRLLIYPEGHLSLIGTHHRYRKGVWHLYQQFDCPVVPAASNLGQRWNQMDWKKYPGTATLEFLPPIQPGLDKDNFMQKLQNMIESASIALLDLDNPGALNPENIGKFRENDSAKNAKNAPDYNQPPDHAPL